MTVSLVHQRIGAPLLGRTNDLLTPEDQLSDALIRCAMGEPLLRDLDPTPIEKRLSQRERLWIKNSSVGNTAQELLDIGNQANAKATPIIFRQFAMNPYSDSSLKWLEEIHDKKLPPWSTEHHLHVMGTLLAEPPGDYERDFPRHTTKNNLLRSTQRELLLDELYHSSLMFSRLRRELDGLTGTAWSIPAIEIYRRGTVAAFADSYQSADSVFSQLQRRTVRFGIARFIADRDLLLPFKESLSSKPQSQFGLYACNHPKVSDLIDHELNSPQLVAGVLLPYGFIFSIPDGAFKKIATLQSKPDQLIISSSNERLPAELKGKVFLISNKTGIGNEQGLAAITTCLTKLANRRYFLDSTPILNATEMTEDHSLDWRDPANAEQNFIQLLPSCRATTFATLHESIISGMDNDEIIISQFEQLSAAWIHLAENALENISLGEAKKNAKLARTILITLAEITEKCIEYQWNIHKLHRLGFPLKASEMASHDESTSRGSIIEYLSVINVERSNRLTRIINNKSADESDRNDSVEEAVLHDNSPMIEIDEIWQNLEGIVTGALRSPDNSEEDFSQLIQALTYLCCFAPTSALPLIKKEISSPGLDVDYEDSLLRGLLGILATSGPNLGLEEVTEISIALQNMAAQDADPEENYESVARLWNLAKRHVDLLIALHN